MEIREAEGSDIPEIVSLLKLSLGESLMPKSERYWRWKHLENPFGPSPVLLCWEGKELIGVRAFMRWEWVHAGHIYKAVRAVDTATHPKHQGKGIFRKLTLSLVDRCKERGDHFVFNTPNQQSKPGYLKMGWEEVARVPVQISINRPLSMMKRLIFRSMGSEIASPELGTYLANVNLDELVKDHHRKSTQMITNISVPYLKWRYEEVPVTSYVTIGEENNGKLTGLILGRIKETRFGRELRITDNISMKDGDGQQLKMKLREKISEWKIDYTSLAGTGSSILKTSKLPFMHINAQAGPMVTIRSLGMTDLTKLKNFNQWSPSLGDLELF